MSPTITATEARCLLSLSLPGSCRQWVRQRGAHVALLPIVCRVDREGRRPAASTAEARALARTFCPGAPEAPEEDHFARFSGNPGSWHPITTRSGSDASPAMPRTTGGRTGRAARATSGRAITPACGDYPSHEGCGEYEAGRVAKKKLPLSLWPRWLGAMDPLR